MYQGFFSSKREVFYGRELFFPLKERGFFFNRRRGCSFSDEEFGCDICGEYTGGELYLRMHRIRKHIVI